MKTHIFNVKVTFNSGEAKEYEIKGSDETVRKWGSKTKLGLRVHRRGIQSALEEGYKVEDIADHAIVAHRTEEDVDGQLTVDNRPDISFLEA